MRGLRHSMLQDFTRAHRHGAFPGFDILPYLPQIAELVLAGSDDLLDYGCGEGKQYTEENWHELWGARPHMYDPMVNAIRFYPKRSYDGVICTHVLECVPEAELDQNLEALAGFARKWCFVAVSSQPSAVILPSGINANVTLHPLEWWRDRLKRAFRRSNARIIVEGN